MLEYHALRELSRNPSHTQRSLAATLDISLGRANYLISGLVDKGLIKAGKLRHPRSIRWNYVLTPKGMREKVRITRDYLGKRMKEYDRLRCEIESLRQEVDGGESVEHTTGSGAA